MSHGHTVALPAPGLPAGQKLRRFFRLHPEWWSMGLALLAWTLVIPHAIAHHGHVKHMMSFQAEFSSWCLMVAAMMLPFMLEPLRWVAFQSFHYRRHQAIALFLVGFFLPWLALGTVVAWLRTLPWTHTPILAAGLFALAAAWTLTLVRQRALVFCHWRVALAPSGWQAARDCLNFGFRIGVSCGITCGLLMVACTATGHNLLAMVAGTVIAGLERRSFRPPVRTVFWCAVVLAVWFALPISSAMLH